MALLLFDIDDTLIRNPISAYQTTMQNAFKQVLGVEVPVDLSGYHGSTDRLIMRDILTKNHVSYDNQTLERCLQRFGELFPENPIGLEVLPGVLKTIPELDRRYWLGLVTGNVETMARKKLRRFQVNRKTLSDYFPFGGFGSYPHEKRADLIALAINRSRRDNCCASLNQTYVIDDSERGMAAAKEAGVIPIGITTGNFLKEQLREAGAKYIIRNFSEISQLPL